jgi:hypothetical protein
VPRVGASAADKCHDFDLGSVGHQGFGVPVPLDDEAVEFDGHEAGVDVEVLQQGLDRAGTGDLQRVAIKDDSHAAIVPYD